MILFCLLTSVMGADCARAQEKASEKNMEVPKVYMFTKISAENLVKIYEALGREATGKVAVKLSTGEPGGHNFLQPALIKDLVKKVNKTIAEVFSESTSCFGLYEPKVPEKLVEKKKKNV